MSAWHWSVTPLVIFMDEKVKAQRNGENWSAPVTLTKVPLMGQLKQQTFIFSPFWSLKSRIGWFFLGLQTAACPHSLLSGPEHP